MIDDTESLTVALHLGDCLPILRSMEPDSMDAVITDPPYSSGGAFRGDRMDSTSNKYQNSEQSGKLYAEFNGDNKDQRAWAYWCYLWLSECYRVMREATPILVFTDWRQLPTATDLLQSAGFVWRGIVAWDKTEAARPQPGRFRNQCEYVVWGSKGPFYIARPVPVLPGVYRHIVRMDDKWHITGKPTPLLEDLVKICESGGHILDPFMGSGTTGVACIRQGYSFTGIELMQEHFTIAKNRIEHAAQPEQEAMWKLN